MVVTHAVELRPEVTDAYDGQAQAVRTIIRKDFEDASKDVDAFVTPTPAFRPGEKIDLVPYVCMLIAGSLLAGLLGLNAIAAVGIQIAGTLFVTEILVIAAYMVMKRPIQTW